MNKFEIEAAAFTAELVADATKQSAKMATGFRGDVATSVNGSQYRVVRANGRVTCYIDGVVQSKADFTVELAYDLAKESERLDALLSK